jgi:hypothetical protein
MRSFVRLGGIGPGQTGGNGLVVQAFGHTKQVNVVSNSVQMVLRNRGVKLAPYP